MSEISYEWISEDNKYLSCIQMKISNGENSSDMSELFRSTESFMGRVLTAYWGCYETDYHSRGIYLYNKDLNELVAESEILKDSLCEQLKTIANRNRRKAKTCEGLDSSVTYMIL